MSGAQETTAGAAGTAAGTRRRLVHKHTGSEDLLSYRIVASEFGNLVADMLGLVWRGLYHIDPTTIRKTDWSDPSMVAINLRQGGLATTDYNELTQLVVLAHDLHVRLSIDAIAPRTLRLTFHKRARDGSYCQRHPTLEQHAEQIRATYTIESGVQS